MLRFAVAAFVLLLAMPAQAQGPFTGRASVVDGDTIEITGQRIRFQGVDAPESWQRCQDSAGKPYRCGKVAADALDTFLAKSRPTRCEFIEYDRYKRVVADCFRADGKSVAEWLVLNGHALDFKRYSKGAYAAAERRASAAKVGMWQGEFDAPWDARKRR
ncbi:thermonuclease family protein [Tianweitania sediminis]|uniref:Thermonuclease family protein n=1 Tax=Tianweitania sediminis TaxID=1502156 RepID=A0A8J7QYN7_9HYPH|nr:thermonuclease family protein [Tianweitania sediminis]MBP0438395.1 thermonuclease family protein [Tianweitania sediminis]